MYSTTLFCDFLVSYCRGQQIKLNHTKLQKLLYILYGSYLSLSGKPLLDEPPRAWVYGPVFASVQSRFGKSFDFNLKPATIQSYSRITKNGELMQIIANCVDHFGSWSSSQLVEWSCREGSPWATTVIRDSFEFGGELVDGLMKSYFVKFAKCVVRESSLPQNSVKNVASKGSEEFNPDIYTLEKQKNYRYGQDTSHRHTLIIWVMTIIPLWLIVVLVIVTFSQIDSNVKIALLGTTTINVLGLPLIVLRGLFGDEREK